MIDENSEVMDTESSDQSSEAIPESDDTRKASKIPENSVAGASPVISATRDNYESNDAASDTNMDLNIDVPLPISPLSSPVKVNKIEEMRVLLCAPNKAAAVKHAKQYPQSKYIRPHSTSKRNHFLFSTQIDSAALQGFKDNFSEFEIEEINIIMIHVVS